MLLLLLLVVVVVVVGVVTVVVAGCWLFVAGCLLFAVCVPVADVQAPTELASSQLPSCHRNASIGGRHVQDICC